MKGYYKILLSAPFISAIAACSSGPAKDFSAPVTLKADSITVNEILRPNGFFPSKNAVAVKTPDEDIFYVYKLPGFEFMYTWGKRGSGPGEFPSKVVEKTNSDGKIAIRTYRSGGRVCELYSIGKKGMEKTESFEDYGFDSNYSGAYVVLDSRLLVGSFIGNDNDRTHTLKLIDMADGAVKDVLYDFYEYTIPFGERPNIGRNNAHVAAYGRKLAVGYEEDSRIDIFDIDKYDRFVPVASTRDEAGPRKNDFNPDVSAVNLRYVALFADGNYIYAVNMRTNMQELTQNRQTDAVLEVFDWRGRPVNTFRFDRKNVVPVFVDGPRKTVYAIARGEDFDRIYTYKLNL